MSKFFKNFLIIVPFSFFYFIRLSDRGSINSDYRSFIGMLFLAYMVISLIYIFYIFIKNKIFYLPILAKITIVTILLLGYFLIENLLLTITIYSIGDSGGWVRNHIYEDINYQFQWYEVLFWNFIFSLHYPIYIFIFFKPFVNHLDQSIQNIREQKNKDKDKGDRLL